MFSEFLVTRAISKDFSHFYYANFSLLQYGHHCYRMVCNLAGLLCQTMSMRAGDDARCLMVTND
jgi:hypothetical protein